LNFRVLKFRISKRLKRNSKLNFSSPRITEFFRYKSGDRLKINDMVEMATN
jgi:hypothetical protein